MREHIVLPPLATALYGWHIVTFTSVNYTYVMLSAVVKGNIPCPRLESHGKPATPTWDGDPKL